MWTGFLRIFFLNFGPKKKSQDLQNGFLHFWKKLKKLHISCYFSKNMSKSEKQNPKEPTIDRNKGTMIKMCKGSFIVCSHTLLKDPELCKKLWPFELYVIRMIYKKAYLVVFLSQIRPYKRYVNIRIQFWCLILLDFRV